MHGSLRFAFVVIGPLLTAPSTNYGAVLWTGGAGAGNEQWSNGTNFSSGLPPAPADDVTFDNTTSAGASDVLTNIVNNSYMINDLTYTTAQYAGNAYHTTQINSGVVLTVTGSFTQGLGSPPLDTKNAGHGDGTDVTISGPGSLVFDNSGGNFLMGNYSGRWDRGSRRDTLDLSGLASFTMDADRWEVGRVGSTPESKMSLADINNITAAILDMAHWNDTAVLELGRENTFHIDTIDLGYDVVNSANGYIRFATGFPDPSIIIRGRDGTGPADLLMAKPSQSNARGDLDLTGGNVDAMFDQVEMGFGRPDQYAGNATGTITFDQGTMSANTVLLAQIRDRGDAYGIINLNGTAQFSAGTITMGDIYDGKVNLYTGLATARISLGGGTLKASTIEPGRDQADVVRTHIREIAFSSGRVQNLASGDLTIDPAISVVLNTAGTHSLHADAGQTITINGVVSDTGSGTAGLSVDGPGTVVLGAANTYSGTTDVLAGTLLVNNPTGSGTGSGTVTVGAGATLGGNGSIGGLALIEAGAHLAPGISPGTLTFNGGLTLQDGAILDFELGTASDLVDITGGTFTGAGTGGVTLNLSDAGGVAIGTTYVLIDWSGATGDVGVELDDFVLGPGSLRGDLQLTPTTLQFTHVPEPGSLILFALGGLALLMRGRRRKRK